MVSVIRLGAQMCVVGAILACFVNGCALDASQGTGTTNDSMMSAQDGVIDPAYHVVPAVGQLFDNISTQVSTGTLFLGPQQPPASNPGHTAVFLGIGAHHGLEGCNTTLNCSMRIHLLPDRMISIPISDVKLYGENNTVGPNDSALFRLQFFVHKVVLEQGQFFAYDQWRFNFVPVLATRVPASGEQIMTLGYGFSQCGFRSPLTMVNRGPAYKRAGFWKWEGAFAGNFEIPTSHLNACQMDSGGPTISILERTISAVTSGYRGKPAGAYLGTVDNAGKSDEEARVYPAEYTVLAPVAQTHPLTPAAFSSRLNELVATPPVDSVRYLSACHRKVDAQGEFLRITDRNECTKLPVCSSSPAGYCFSAWDPNHQELLAQETRIAYCAAYDRNEGYCLGAMNNCRYLSKFRECWPVEIADNVSGN